MKLPKQLGNTLKSFQKQGHFLGLTFGWFFGPWKILTEPIGLKLVEMNAVACAVQLVDVQLDPST